MRPELERLLRPEFSNLHVQNTQSWYTSNLLRLFMSINLSIGRICRNLYQSYVPNSCVASIYTNFYTLHAHNLCVTCLFRNVNVFPFHGSVCRLYIQKLVPITCPELRYKLNVHNPVSLYVKNLRLN
jgi:hypothetical protein